MSSDDVCLFEQPQSPFLIKHTYCTTCSLQGHSLIDSADAEHLVLLFSSSSLSDCAYSHFSLHLHFTIFKREPSLVSDSVPSASRADVRSNTGSWNKRTKDQTAERSCVKSKKGGSLKKNKKTTQVSGGNVTKYIYSSTAQSWGTCTLFVTIFFYSTSVLCFWLHYINSGSFISTFSNTRSAESWTEEISIFPDMTHVLLHTCMPVVTGGGWFSVRDMLWVFNYIMFAGWRFFFFIILGRGEVDVEGGGAVLSAPPERSANKNMK